MVIQIDDLWWGSTIIYVRVHCITKTKHTIYVVFEPLNLLGALQVKPFLVIKIRCRRVSNRIPPVMPVFLAFHPFFRDHYSPQLT